MEKRPNIVTFCSKCETTTFHEVITGWDGYELENIYFKCYICKHIFYIEKMREKQIKNIEEEVEQAELKSRAAWHEGDFEEA